MDVCPGLFDFSDSEDSGEFEQNGNLVDKVETLTIHDKCAIVGDDTTEISIVHDLMMDKARRMSGIDNYYLQV